MVMHAYVEKWQFTESSHKKMEAEAYSKQVLSKC